MAKSDQNMNDSKVAMVTEEGFKKLQDELEHLKNVRRREVAEHIKEAISYGDLSENSEYEEAKNEQAFVEGRILELEDMIKNVKVIQDKAAGKKSTAAAVVQFGSTVTVKEESTDAVEQIFTIVGSSEADPFNGKISNESPLGQAIMEQRVGDVVEFQAPKGMVKYKIIKVS